MQPWSTKRFNIHISSFLASLPLICHPHRAGDKLDPDSTPLPPLFVVPAAVVETMKNLYIMMKIGSFSASKRAVGACDTARRWGRDLITESVDGDRAPSSHAFFSVHGPAFVNLHASGSGLQPRHSADTVTVQIQTKMGFDSLFTFPAPFHSINIYVYTW